MDSKTPGTLSLLGAVSLIGIWWVFLLTARPDCLDSVQLAMASAKYALSPNESGSWLFVFTLASIIICIASSLILFIGKNKNIAIYLIGTHTIAAAFLYTWSLVLVIALPLVCFLKLQRFV